MFLSKVIQFGFEVMIKIKVVEVSTFVFVTCCFFLLVVRIDICGGILVVPL